MEIIVLVCLVVVFIVLLLACVFTSYFLPSIVAWVRHKQDFMKILLINIFAGWAPPVWIYICVCAFLDNPSESTGQSSPVLR